VIKIVDLSIGITGVMAYDNIYVLKGKKHEERFKNIEEICNHIIDTAQEFSKNNLTNYNLLDEEFNYISNLLNLIKTYDILYKNKHVNLMDYDKYLPRYINRYLKK